MKTSIISFIATCLVSLSSANAANIVTNGDFGTGTLSGWTPSTTSPTIVSSIVADVGSSVRVSNGTDLTQDLNSSGSTGLANFQFDIAFQVAAPTNTARIRLRGEGVIDFITLSLTPTSINAFIPDKGGLVPVISGLSITANTTYYLRITGTNMGTTSRSYVVGYSLDGVNYASSDNLTGFHASGPTPVATLLETVRFEGGTTGNTALTIDNISVVAIPEPAAVLLGLTGSLLSLRRKRNSIIFRLKLK